MEDKKIILSVFIMSLVMTQIQGEAKSCCPSSTARNLYNLCLLTGASRPTCAQLSGCKIISGTKCPPPFSNGIFENSGNGVDGFCKLGCISSVCSALNTIKNSDANKIVNGAVDQCAKACSTFCIKGSMTTVETA